MSSTNYLSKKENLMRSGLKILFWVVSYVLVQYVVISVLLTHFKEQALAQYQNLPDDAPAVRMIHEQFDVAFWNVGDMLSRALGRPVSDILATSFGPTLILIGSAMIVALALGLILGWIGLKIRSAGAENKGLGSAIVSMGRLIMFALAAIPVAALPVLLIWLFAVKFRILPAGSMYIPGMEGNLVDLLRHLILPALALSLLPALVIAQQLISRAKSSGSQKIGLNGILYSLKVNFSLIGLIVSGALIVETIFNWPGIGRRFVTSLMNNDYGLFIGTLATIILITFAGKLIAELIGMLIQARARETEQDEPEVLENKHLPTKIWAVISSVLIIATAYLLISGALLVDNSLATRGDFEARLQAPSSEHAYGTDGVGRDLKARTFKSAANSIWLVLLSALITLIPAALLGYLSARLRSRRSDKPFSLDDLIVLPMKAITLIPVLPSAMLIIILMGLGMNAELIVLAIALVFLPRATLAMRAHFLSSESDGPTLHAWRRALGFTIFGTLFMIWSLDLTLSYLRFGIGANEFPELGVVFVEFFSVRILTQDFLWVPTILVTLISLSFLAMMYTFLRSAKHNDALVRLLE